MCGINGITWKDPVLIERMNHAVRHRGPDDQGTYVDESVTLGHRRLSIIDLSSLGRQPMSNEDGSLWIVFNGEIYNFMEIRMVLEERGYRFKSNTDTEVIIHSYREWGFDCVNRFNGMWAFGLYDKAKNLIFLSRDRFGIKPLYYLQNEKGLIFSSEIKGILQCNIERVPNHKVVYTFLALGLVDESSETFFKDVYRLMPGENLVFDISSHSKTISRWYDLSKRTKDYSQLQEEDLKEMIRDLFQDSVRYRLISDVPVGSCLSGGIDSSAIVYAMRKQNPKGKIKTFSMVFPGNELDESEYVDEVVKGAEVESHRITPLAEELVKELQDLTWTQEEPFGTLSIYGQYKVMDLAHRKGMKVLLDGQGSDELFAGYFIYFKYYIFESLFNLRICEFLKTAFAAKDKRNDFIIFPIMTLLSKMGFSQGLLKNLWVGGMKFLRGYEEYSLSNPLLEKGFSLNRALYSDLIRYSLPALLRYEDKNSMRWSIESRVPFLDYRLVELVMSLSYRCKISGGTTKYILRKALRGLVSNKILDRRDKIAFATPDENWISSPLFSEIARKIIASERFGSRKYWNQGAVVRLHEEHLNGKRSHGPELWRIINTELWLRTFIDVEKGT